MRKGRRSSAVVMGVLLAVGLACGRSFLSAASAFEVSLGLGDRIVLARPTLIRLTPVDGLGDAVRFRAVQDAGNAWRGESTLSFEAPLVLSDDGDYEVVFPLHETSAPLRIELLAADGSLLAHREVELRPRMEEEPFPVVVGSFSAPLPDRSVVVSPAELPRDASGLAAAESVWIGQLQTGLDAARWDALARWVLSGGTLVVFSGSDFFLLDAPRLRELLPITSPVVAGRADGTHVVAGDLRRGANVLITDSGAPLLVSGPYGAGCVLLVTTSAPSLDRNALAAIQSRVPPARRLTLADVASDLLDRQPVIQPGAWFAFVLLILAVAALSALAARSHERRWMPTALVGVFCALSLLTWLYASSARSVRDAYQTRVTLSVYSSRSSMGAWRSCCALASASHRPTTIDVPLEAAPVQVVESRFATGSSDLAYREAVAHLELAPLTRRLLESEGSRPGQLQAWLTGDEGVELRSRIPRSLSAAILLVDGVAFCLPTVRPREMTAYLGSPLLADAVHLGVAGGPLDLVFAAAARALPLDRGVWLVAGDVREALRTGGTTRVQTRDVALYVAEVERD